MKQNRTRAACVAVVLAFAAAADAAVIYVNASAQGMDTGMSWKDAFNDLQDALMMAKPGDEIWVAAGVYRPDANDRDGTFMLVQDVALYGGFAGAEGLREHRNWEKNITVLSGDLGANDGPGFTGMEENAYHVVTAMKVSGAVLDGFHVTAGRGDGPGEGASHHSRDQGSGINVFGATPRIENCVIRGNWSRNHGAVNDHGSSTVRNCVFDGNYSADFGAGLYIHHEAMTVAEGCLFVNNVAVNDGGGSYCRSHMGPKIIQCVYTGNRARRGAGLYTAPGSMAEVRSSYFTDQEAGMGGGGIYNDQSDTLIVGCLFRNNEAGFEVEGGSAGGGGSGGGGIWSTGGFPLISHCLFVGNVASFGGAVYAIEGGRAEYEGCSFIDNHATEAGASYSLLADTVTRDCVFIGNTATGGADFAVGGAVSNYFSNTVMHGCSFEGNFAELGGGAIYNEGEAPVINRCEFRRNSAFSDLQGWGGGVMNGYFSYPRITNCAFSGNGANLGGAIYNFAFSEPKVANCTIVGNSAGEGGGIGNHELGAGIFTGCIVWANLPEQVGPGASDVTYSCVEGGRVGVGNISVAPMIVEWPSAGKDGVVGTADDTDGDLALRPGSPCIDAGDNGALPADIVADLAGAPRFSDDPGTPDSGSGKAPVVDMGAYEFAGTSCRADFDGDGFVTGQDFDAFVGAFETGDPAADFDRDGFITGADFDSYVAAYELGC